MQQLLLERLGGTSVEYTARSTESVLARLHFVVRLPVGRRGRPGPVDVDVDALQAELAAGARSWTDDLSDALAPGTAPEAERLLRPRRRRLPGRLPGGLPRRAGRRRPRAARRAGRGRSWRCGCGRRRAPAPGERRLTVYRVGERLLLSDVLPVLQHMGVDVVDERPYEIDRIGAPPSWIYDFGVAVPAVGAAAAALAARAVHRGASRAVWRGEAEDDGLGALVHAGRAELAPGRRRPGLRAVAAPGRAAVRPGLRRADAGRAPRRRRPAGRAVRDPLLPAARPGGRASGRRSWSSRCARSIGEVESLDADRVLSSLLAAVTATQRTTLLRRRRHRLALKLDPAGGARPARAAARRGRSGSARRGSMGVHLRFGAVARGGLRWSDRREDLRTEVLGLVKAQMVKNTVIVPTGAKGGFVVKRPPARGRHPRRGAWPRAGLLQDLHRGAAVAHRQPGRRRRSSPPERVVRHDGDDTYLVVAADKGTATFSDLANSMAIERGFWLGDAFASGGSVGYDHKAMGITARGAWESVTRHFRELDLDVAEAGVHRRRHRRHVRRRLRQRHAAVGAHPAARRLRPPARVRRPLPRRGGVLRRAARGCSPCRARRGRTTTRR